MQLLNLLRLFITKYWYVVVALLFVGAWWFYRKQYIGKKGLLIGMVLSLITIMIGAAIGFKHVIDKEDAYIVDPKTHHVVPKIDHP